MGATQRYGAMAGLREAGRCLRSDPCMTLIYVGIPAVLSVALWFGSTFLCSSYLAELLHRSFRADSGTSITIAAGVSIVFMAASVARLIPPGFIQRIGDFTCALVMGVWLTAAASEVTWQERGADSDIAVCVLSWIFASNWAASRLVGVFRKPNITRHNLYRFFDANGRLLYVGITDHVRRRFGQHRREKPWFQQVATREVVHYGSRAELEAAEIEAIRKERPLHNIIHSGSRR